MITNETLLNTYKQKPSIMSSLEGFHPQLMETYAATHNQTLEGAWGILERRSKKQCRSQTGQGHNKKNNRTN